MQSWIVPQHKSSHMRWDWAQLCSNTTLFLDTKIWISRNSRMSRYIITILIFFFTKLKRWKRFSAIGPYGNKQQRGFGPWACGCHTDMRDCWQTWGSLVLESISAAQVASILLRRKPSRCPAVPGSFLCLHAASAWNACPSTEMHPLQFSKPGAWALWGKGLLVHPEISSIQSWAQCPEDTQTTFAERRNQGMHKRQSIFVLFSSRSPILFTLMIR